MTWLPGCAGQEGAPTRARTPACASTATVKVCTALGEVQRQRLTTPDADTRVPIECTAEPGCRKQRTSGASRGLSRPLEPAADPIYCRSRQLRRPG